MPCVCCWGNFKDLSKHYPHCPYIRGDWTFWASPYQCTIVYDDRDAFTEYIKSFKPDKGYIESTPSKYVSPRDWTTDSREDAMRRQLMNTLYEYFRTNSIFSDKWQVLNDGDMIPDLDNVDDIGKALADCSKLLRSAPSGVEITSPISELKQIFGINTEAVDEIITPPAGLGKRRRNMSVSYTALDSIKPIDKVKVEIGDTGFTGADFAQHQRRQIAACETPQNQYPILAFGGVVQVDSASNTLGSSNLMPAGGIPNASIPLRDQIQAMEAFLGNLPSDAAENQYGSQNYPMEDMPHFPQTTQLEQGALANQHSDSAASNAVNDFDRWYLNWQAQYSQALPQMQNANSNVNADMNFAFNDWDSFSQPQPQNLSTLRQGQDAHVNANASASNAVDAFSSWNFGVQPQYAQVPHHRQNTNANINVNTDDALNTFDFRNPDPFPAYDDRLYTGHDTQQYMGHQFSDYHAR